MAMVELKFTCPQCGCRAVNVYLDDDYDEYRQDWRRLQDKTLRCGNCENDAELTDEEEARQKQTAQSK